MKTLLINKKIYQEIAFVDEQELEDAVVNNQVHVFGKNVVYIDYKRKTSNLSGRISGIPDGFLVDFSNLKTPQLFFVEYELESHDLYDHIGVQIMKFYATYETGKRELQVKLTNLIKEDIELRREFEKKITQTPLENIDSLVNFFLYDGKLGIVVVIDEQTEDLNALFRRFSEIPEIIEIVKFKSNNDVVYQYDSFREEIDEQIGNVNIKSNRDELDTIVCPARAEGFQNAFINQDAWWAVRIAPFMISQIKYIAIYEKLPIAAIRWMARVKQSGIQPYKNTGKYILYLEDKKRIGPVKLDEGKLGTAPQGPRYTSLNKLLSANKISQLW